MSNVTKPIILDETGLRIAQAIESLAQGGSGSKNYVTPEMYGAKGDGETDDSQAVQDAVDSGYAVYFESNKTYYLASTVTIDHDIHLFGGENTVIKTATPSGGSAYNGVVINGTLKKTTTLTTNYSKDGTTANSNNRFTLTDMTGINIGDIMVIEATDQFYHYARDYYYLGASLLVTEIYNGHIYTSDSMPYDIENTENVSVKIYSAPRATVENLKFISSGFDGGNYRYLLSLINCNGSEVKNCIFTEMDNGINIVQCVNTKVENVSLSKSKYDNSLEGDGYGIVVDSCYNTIIERLIAMCAQHAISVTGHLPSINTYVRHCALTAECRRPGLDTHEAVYNLVVEDSTLGTACLNGFCTINRCKIISNRRVSDADMSISVYGSHEPSFSKIIILNTEFSGPAGISIIQSSLQSPVQAFDNVYGDIRIENCIGGSLEILPETNSTILSNTIQNLTIKNWQGCKEIFVSGTWSAKKSTIENSTFIEKNFINDHYSEHGVVTDKFEYLDVINIQPLTHKKTVNRDTMGENLVLPEDVVINLSSNNSSAKYIVCGANIKSDNVDDYFIGQVNGPDGGTLSRSVATSGASLSKNANGDFVYTQAGNSSGEFAWYPVGLFAVKETSKLTISAKIKNTGNTSGAKFRAYIVIVDIKTGKIVTRTNGSAVTASADGAEIMHTWDVRENQVAMAYFYCNGPEAGAETTFEDFSVLLTPFFAPAVINKPYTAKRLTGDGTILSLDGVNNIMCSDLNFHVSLKADYVNNPV